jgi:hypothetical protein
MMKSKFLKMSVMAMFAIFTLSVIPQVSYAQLSKKQEKQLQKARDKEYKNKLKEYRKDGWKIAGSSKSIDVALLEHYAKLAEKGNKEIVGEVGQCRSVNICREYALTNAQNYYANLAGGKVEGLVTSLLRGNAENPKEEVDKFSGAFKKQVAVDVSGALTESYSIVRENGDTKEYKIFYILNEEEGRAACERALKKSLKETKLVLKEMDEVSKFINENVTIEE